MTQTSGELASSALIYAQPFRLKDSTMDSKIID